MTFIDFCQSLGVMVDAYPPVGVWKRFPTTDKANHRNGSVKFMGDHGFVQNWATMERPASWSDASIDEGKLREIHIKSSYDIAASQRKASEKAQWILSQCELLPHAYLASKGFPDELVNVWRRGDAQLMVVPMKVGGAIVGCQLIGSDGEKKFLSGQRTGGAEFTFGSGSLNVVCEGYATALSVRHALRSLKRKYTLHVCFSAANMVRIASSLPAGAVIADNDESGTGERYARQIGWPFWMSDTVGDDANDYHRRAGIFALSQGIGSVIRGRT